GGADRDRTGDLLNANQALSQLSYSPSLGFTQIAFGFPFRNSFGHPCRPGFAGHIQTPHAVDILGISSECSVLRDLTCRRDMGWKLARMSSSDCLYLLRDRLSSYTLTITL